MSQTELQEFVVDEIRKRVNNHIAPLRAEAKRHGLVLEMSDWGRDRE